MSTPSNDNDSDVNKAPPSEQKEQPDTNSKTRGEIPYSKERTRYRKEALLNQFSKILQTSASVDQVCEYFHITRTSYYRWVGLLAKRDGKFMRKYYSDVLINEVNTTAEQFKSIIFQMNQIMKDKNTEAYARIDAAKVAGEVQLLLMKVYKDGPSAAWTTMPMPVKRVITETYDTKPELPFADVPGEGEQGEEFRTRKRKQQQEQL